MSFTEREITVENAYSLAGTLTIPNREHKQHPIVVMVHGSGAVDRDENVKGLHMNVFNQLSEFFATIGFATLRYDKRGVGESGGDFYETGLFDLIDDAVSVITFAKALPEIDPNKVILLGHSEGSMIAPAISKKADVQGMILLAGTAEPLEETSARQRQQVKEELSRKKGMSGALLRLFKVPERIEKTNDKLMNKILKSDEQVIRYLGKKVNAKWFREHHQYDVREHLVDVTCPVLAITGTKDVQVRPSHAKKICELVQGECEHILIEHMTHVLRKTAVTPSILNVVKDYKKQVKEPLDNELLDSIRTWLNRKFPTN